jgi:hypothetical protein
MTYSQSFIVYFQRIIFSKLVGRGLPGNQLNINVSSIPSFSWRYSLCRPSSDYSPSFPLFYHEAFYLFLSCSSPAAVHCDGTTVWLSRSNNYQAAKRTKVCNFLSYGGVARLTSDIGPPLASGGTGKSKCCEQTETSSNTHSVCAPRKL